MSDQVIDHPPQTKSDLFPKEITALRPSEYTALLIQALRAQPDLVRGADALEIGIGSGAVLAAIGDLGALSLCGVDVESVSVTFATQLLKQLGYAEQSKLYCGDMWKPVADRQFDLIVANLPQFPMEEIGYSGRMPSWSSGGSNGRRLLDRFLLELGQHLKPTGRALITHNGFIDLDLTKKILEKNRLKMKVTMTMLINLTDEKKLIISKEILQSQMGRSIYNYGSYTFADLHIVEIGMEHSPD